MEPIEILQKLTTCWCEALAASPGGAPMSCCMVASDPVIPNCCAGFAWTRIIAIQPVYPGGQPQRCVPPGWKIVLELGISRCAPPICGDGAQNPCCENEAVAVNVQQGDFFAAVRAFGCCLTARPTDPYADFVSPDQVQLGAWAVDDPSGGCVTARMTAAITTNFNCSCP